MRRDFYQLEDYFKDLYTSFTQGQGYFPINVYVEMLKSHYSKTSMTETPMACLPWLIRTHF